MKATFTSLLLFCFTFTHATNSTFQKLCEVNQYWLQQKDINLNSIPQNLSLPEREWIRFHLMSVEKILRSRNVNQLSSSQKQNHEKCLDYLHQYWTEGNFPINEDYTYQTPIFIDKHNNFCAVGYLIKASGHENISRMIASKTNLAYVREMNYPQLFAWANENGFNVDELAWIQPAYSPSTVYYGLDGGVNGAINSIVVDTTSQVVYVGGSFTQTGNGTGCNHIAAWVNGITGWNWTMIGNGLDGVVQTLLLYNNKLYAGGDFTSHIAMYDITNNQWQSIGSLDSTVRSITVYNGEVFAGGDFTGNVSKWNGTSWQTVTQSMVSGSVRTLEVWNNLLVIGGNFELTTGAIRKHVVAFNGTQMVLMGMGTLTPVNDFEFFDGKLLAGCDFASGTDTCAIASYDGTNWQIYLKPPGTSSSNLSGNTIKKIIAQDSTLLVGGDFYCSINIGLDDPYGKNLMLYAPVYSVMFGAQLLTFYNLCAPLSYLDNTVNVITNSSTGFLFGGDFITYDHGFGPNDTLNHIASKNSFTVGLNDLAQEKMSIIIFPNPAINELSINLSGLQAEQMSVYNVDGKLLSETKQPTNNRIDISNLATGIYVVEVKVRDAVQRVRWVKM